MVPLHDLTRPVRIQIYSRLGYFDRVISTPTGISKANLNLETLSDST